MFTWENQRQRVLGRQQERCVYVRKQSAGSRNHGYVSHVPPKTVTISWERECMHSEWKAHTTADGHRRITKEEQDTLERVGEKGTLRSGDETQYFECIL